VDQLAGKGPGLAAGFLLTFDVGRLLVQVDPDAGRVHSLLIESAAEMPPGLEAVSEEEPWWRLVGCPLARVGAGEVGAQGLRLQFRADGENPRVVVLQPSANEVQAILEPTSGST
jgi:hypothetical protein